MGNRSKYIRQTGEGGSLFDFFFLFLPISSSLFCRYTCDGIDWMNMSLRLAANDSFSGRQGCDGIKKEGKRPERGRINK